MTYSILRTREGSEQVEEEVCCLAIHFAFQLGVRIEPRPNRGERMKMTVLVGFRFCLAVPKVCAVSFFQIPSEGLLLILRGNASPFLFLQVRVPGCLV
jgi:hypothetical protein